MLSKLYSLFYKFSQGMWPPDPLAKYVLYTVGCSPACLTPTYLFLTHFKFSHHSKVTDRLRALVVAILIAEVFFEQFLICCVTG